MLSLPGEYISSLSDIEGKYVKTSSGDKLQARKTLKNNTIGEHIYARMHINSFKNDLIPLGIFYENLVFYKNYIFVI